MRFNPKARLDTGRIRSGGGGGGGLRGGGGRLPIPGGRIGGGGIVGLLIAVAIYVVSTQLGGGGGGLGGGLNPSAFQNSSVGLTGSGQGFDYGTCQTGEDANEHEECAMVAVENSLDGYWAQQPQIAGRFHSISAVTFFSGQVQTNGCGGATSDSGPFYCPAQSDQGIYLDPTFFDTVYEQLGGRDSVFVRTYVLAHEYGHHISNLLGNMGRVRTQQGPQSDAVRLELQADCFAGMWTAYAEGDGLIEDITDQDIRQGIEAATVVGDDHIQDISGGRNDPSQYTHGSSAQRVAWFRAGMSDPDDIAVCDTFSARDLNRP